MSPHPQTVKASARLRLVFRVPAMVRQAFVRAFDHDAPNIAQSAAYSGIIALFPALIVAAAVVARLPDTTAVRYELAAFFDRILPADVLPLLTAYFEAKPPAGSGIGPSPTTTRALLLGVLVSIWGASGVIATFMEGLRRAGDLSPDCWSFLRRRTRAIVLVPLSLLPLATASVLVVFGHFISLWLAAHVAGVIRTPVFLLALLVRWTFALTGSVGITALLYRMGTPVLARWRRVLPGAIVATVLWFVATLAFGWYVTRFANYSRVYGSLGAGIALLVWLYLISLSVLCGAEFNAVFARECDAATRKGSPGPTLGASRPSHRVE